MRSNSSAKRENRWSNYSFPPFSSTPSLLFYLQNLVGKQHQIRGVWISNEYSILSFVSTCDLFFKVCFFFVPGRIAPKVRQLSTNQESQWMREFKAWTQHWSLNLIIFFFSQNTLIRTFLTFSSRLHSSFLLFIHEPVALSFSQKIFIQLCISSQPESVNLNEWEWTTTHLLSILLLSFYLCALKPIQSPFSFFPPSLLTAHIPDQKEWKIRNQKRHWIAIPCKFARSLFPIPTGQPTQFSLLLVVTFTHAITLLTSHILYFFLFFWWMRRQLRQRLRRLDHRRRRLSPTAFWRRQWVWRGVSDSKRYANHKEPTTKTLFSNFEVRFVPFPEVLQNPNIFCDFHTADNKNRE